MEYWQFGRHSILGDLHSEHVLRKWRPCQSPIVGARDKCTKQLWEMLQVKKSFFGVNFMASIGDWQWFSFLAGTFTIWLNSMGFRHFFIVIRHPLSNDQVENFFRILKTSFDSIVASTLDELERGVDTLLLPDRRAKNSVSYWKQGFYIRIWGV